MTNSHRSALLLLLTFLTGILPAAASAEETDRETAEALVSRWLAVEQQRSAIRSNWAERQSLGRSQLSLLEKEEATLRRFLTEANSAEAESDARRAELLAEQSRLEEESAALEEALPFLSDRMETLQRRLPPPLALLWEDSMPDLLDTDAGNSQRLAALLKILRQSVDWQQRIPVHRTLMAIQGREVLVDQVYLGLAHGWYVSLDGALAGRGYATRDEWVWEEPVDTGSTLGGDLLRLIEKNKAPDGRLVALPMSIERPEAPQ